MYEWNEAVQKMIDYIEANIKECLSLEEISRQIGYSPYYCSAQFHKICGITIKSYISLRRLALSTLEIRDTNKRIIDIAVKYGFSSQEALTRAFRSTFGCTPASYRKNPVPIPLPIRKVIYFPEHYHKLYKGENTMNKTILTEPKIRIEHIPAHKYIGIWDDTALGYGDFWKYHNCDEVCGIIESMRNVAHPVVSPHTAGWHIVNGERRYFYGFGVSSDYDGVVPEGFTIKEFPESYYMVFFHPPFSYLEDNNEVMKKVENLAWNYDLESKGLSDENLDYHDGRNMYEWNEEICQCYQRHSPEVLGYEVLRPIKIKIK